VKADVRGLSAFKTVRTGHAGKHMQSIHCWTQILRLKYQYTPTLDPKNDLVQSQSTRHVVLCR
jgi:hypothetical protein